MGRVSATRSLAVLALVAASVTACSSSSSSSATSSPDTGTTASSGSTGGVTAGATAGTSLELRPIYARYASGVPLGTGGSGLALGPQVPDDVVSDMKSHQCSGAPTVLQGMLMECDAGGTVFLLKAPIAAGGVAKAVAKKIGHEKLWYVDVTFDQKTTDVLAAAVTSMPGTELAFALEKTVLVSPIIDDSMADGTVGIVGNYNQKQATALARQIAAG